MNITATDKVLLGSTIAIATVTAGVVRLWMALPAFALSLIVIAMIVRFVDFQRKAGGSRSKAPMRTRARGDMRWDAEDFRRNNEDVAVDPSNKILAGNIWHGHGHDE